MSGPEEAIIQHIARAIHADEHQRRFVGAWDKLTSEMRAHYERVGRLRLESVRAAEAAVAEESEAERFILREFFGAAGTP